MVPRACAVLHAIPTCVIPAHVPLPSSSLPTLESTLEPVRRKALKALAVSRSIQPHLCFHGSTIEPLLGLRLDAVGEEVRKFPEQVGFIGEQVRHLLQYVVDTCEMQEEHDNNTAFNSTAGATSGKGKNNYYCSAMVMTIPYHPVLSIVTMEFHTHTRSIEGTKVPCGRTSRGP